MNVRGKKTGEYIDGLLKNGTLPAVILVSGYLVTSCGGGSTSTDPAADELDNTLFNQPLPAQFDGTHSDTPVANDSSSLRNLSVSFTVPGRLLQLGTALSASVTAGGTEMAMLAVGGDYEVDMLLPPDQQLHVYVAVRRVEDGLLVAAAQGVAWLGDAGAALALPEQQFVYNFDTDGDGVFNIVEIERGTSPAIASLDYDADGLPDDADRDDDNDGVPDSEDAFPFNGQEFEDTDNDGIGNNADPDDDEDGVIDDHDAFPLNSNETTDSDFDGIGDNADTDADGNGIEDDQEDSDQDGIPDAIDIFPDDYYEWADRDGDGIGDNQDADDDNNGIQDYREGTQIIVAYVDDADIVIDGIADSWSENDHWYEEWGKATDTDSGGDELRLRNNQMQNSSYTSSEGYYSWGRSFEMLHDAQYLYILVYVYGEELEDWSNDSADIWHDDSAELYFDVGYDQLDAYGDNDYQRLFRFRDNVADPTIDGNYSADGMITDYATSYRHENSASSVYSHTYEIRVSLDSIGLEPGDTFGFELAINDDDDGGARDDKWGWWAPIGTDDAWQRPAVFGKAKLQPAD